MTGEEILNKAHDYARNNIERTEEDGYDIIEGMRLVDAYLAGAKDNAPQWHYPSKGELPELSKRVLVKAKYQEDVYVGEVFSPDAFTVALLRWVLYTDDVDRFYSDKEIIAWQYLPEPPKEM